MGPLEEIKVCSSLQEFKYTIKKYPVFRLRRDNKNLISKEYAENLKSYLGSARKTTTISVSDLSDAICKITGVTNTNTDCHDEEMPAAVNCGESLLKPGEHVAVYWVEEANSNNVVWYLGIVDEISNENVAKIIHLKRSDKKEHNWIIPDLKIVHFGHFPAL